MIRKYLPNVYSESVFTIDYKKLKKKPISAIILILISAVLGILLYGVLG